MNPGLRVGGKSAGQKVGGTFERVWRAQRRPYRAAKGRIGGPRRSQRRTAGLAAPCARSPSSGAGRAGASRKGRQGKKKRRDPGQVPPLFGPAGRGVPGTRREGKGGDGMSLSGWCRWIRSVRCGRWPHPQNGPPRWRRRVRDVEMPWSAKARDRTPLEPSPADARPASGRPRTRTERGTRADDASSGLTARLTASRGRFSLPGPREARRVRARSVRAARGPAERSW